MSKVLTSDVILNDRNVNMYIEPICCRYYDPIQNERKSVVVFLFYYDDILFFLVFVFGNNKNLPIRTKISRLHKIESK